MNDFGSLSAEMARHYSDHAEAARSELGKINVVLGGNAGVGKSTLANAVFGRAVAPVGIGLSQTLDITAYENDHSPLRIYDTRGFEIRDAERTVTAVRSKIEQLRAETDANRQIHIAWLCILEQSHRVEAVHTSFLRMLREQRVPSIVVITQALGEPAVEASVRALAVPHDSVVPVMAEDKHVGPHVIKAHGLGALVEAALTLLPDAQAQAFIAAQQARWDLKEAAAMKAINRAAMLATASALIPISGGHSTAVIRLQAQLMATINALLGISLTETAGRDLAQGFLGIGLARAGGQAAFGLAMTEIARLFPGVGWLGAAAIGGPIAGSLTKLFGHLYFETVTPYARDGVAVPAGDDLAKRMQELLQQNRDRYRTLIKND